MPQTAIVRCIVTDNLNVSCSICSSHAKTHLATTQTVPCIERVSGNCGCIYLILSLILDSLSEVAQRGGVGRTALAAIRREWKMGVLGGISYLTTFGSGKIAVSPGGPIAHYFSALETMSMPSTNAWCLLTYLLSEATKRENRILRNCYVICINCHKFLRPICVNWDLTMCNYIIV